MEIIQVSVAGLDIIPKVPLLRTTLLSIKPCRIGAQAEPVIVQSVNLPNTRESMDMCNLSAAPQQHDAKKCTKHHEKSPQMHHKYSKYAGILQIELRERIHIWQLLDGEDHQQLRQVCLPFKQEIDTFIGLPVVYTENNYKNLGPIPPASYLRLTAAIVGYHLQNALKQPQLLTQITLDGPIRQHLFTLLLIKTPNLQILRATTAFTMDASSRLPSPQGARKTEKILKNSLERPDQSKLLTLESVSGPRTLLMRKLHHLQFDGTEEIKFNRFFTIISITDILTRFNFPVLQTFEINFFFAQSTEIYALVKLVCNCIVEYRRTLKHLHVAIRAGTDVTSSFDDSDYQHQPSHEDSTQNSLRNNPIKLGRKQRDFKSLSLKTLKTYVDESVSLPFYILARAQHNLSVYEQLKTRTTWSHHIPILLRNHASLHTVRIYAVEPIINLGAFVSCTNLKILHISRHFSANNNFNYSSLRSLPRLVRIGEIIRMHELPISLRQLYFLGYNIESDEIAVIAEKLLYLEILDIQLPGYSTNLNSGTKYKLGLFPDTIQKILTLRHLNKLILEDYLNEFNDTFEFICQIIPKLCIVPDRFILPSSPRRLYIIMIMDPLPTPVSTQHSETEHNDKLKLRNSGQATASWSKRCSAYL